MHMKNTLALKIGIVLPILMVLLVIGMIYIPTHYIRPQYNFVYATGGNYYWQSQYAIEKQQIIKQSLKRAPNQPVLHEQLYLYNVALNQSQALSFTQAQALKLDSTAQSPDGFNIVAAANGNSFFQLFILTPQNYNLHYLQKNSYSKRLALKLDGQHYNNFYFLGWVLNGKTTIT